MSNRERKNRRNPTVTPKLLRQNTILYGVSAPVLERIIQGGELLDLAVRQKIYEPEQPIEDVYFPIECVLSIVTRMADGHQIEIGTIGREGMSALPLILGASATANDCYCQVPGPAFRISAELFRELNGSDPQFRQLLDRYFQAYVNMLGQLAACNRLHTVYERCARWLLMTRDRVSFDEIPLTHEYLAMMLGTGRSGVTIAVGTLQQAGFIFSNRGFVAILNREGLAQASCECYEVAREQFSGLLRSVNASGGATGASKRQQSPRTGEPRD